MVFISNIKAIQGAFFALSSNTLSFLLGNFTVCSKNIGHIFVFLTFFMVQNVYMISKRNAGLPNVHSLVRDPIRQYCWKCSTAKYSPDSC